MSELGLSELALMQKGFSDQKKIMFMTQYNSVKKDRTVAFILSFLLGGLGIDRFYVGDIALGVLKLLTLGCIGIWAFIDLFLIMGRVDEINRRKARELIYIIDDNKVLND